MNEEKFTGKADVYDKYRPSYPAELVDRLYEKTGAAAVADIGAGTGIFTQCLCAKPWRVTAVEPNEDMLRKLRGRLPGAEAVNAAAEDTGLDVGSVGLVTAATAFHWFDKEKFREECRRILTPGGYLALIWNNHLDSPLMGERDRVFIKYCGMCNSTAGFIGEDFWDKYFSSMERYHFDNPVYMDRERFLGYCLSHSYSLKRGDENYGEFVSELERVFSGFQEDGRVEVLFGTDCYLGQL